MRTASSSLLLSLALSGCAGVRYVGQAAAGQLSLLRRARSISAVLADPGTPGETRWLLEQVAGIKRFGEQNGLRATQNYRRYVQLDGPAVVWVVSACEPLRFKGKSWHFPVVGDVPYLGWFDKADAVAFAESLRAQGLDVDVRGATAYSTLGWFRDPLLSSMLRPGDEALGELANVVLHESVHATVYVPGQAHFNESLASFVADRLARRYLAAVSGEDSPELASYDAAQAADQSRAERIHRAYLDLDALYRSNVPDEQKRAEKARLLSHLQADLKLTRPFNNAAILQFRTYSTGTADFARLYEACGHEWSQFFSAVRALRRTDFTGPDQEDFGPVLSRLAATGCSRS